MIPRERYQATHVLFFRPSYSQLSSENHGRYSAEQLGRAAPKQRKLACCGVFEILVRGVGVQGFRALGA